MRLTFTLLICTFLFAGLTAAEKGNEANNTYHTNISGNVVDIHNGQSLAGVKVTLEGTGKCTYTNFDGEFTFDQVPAGKYKVVSHYISYKPQVVEVKPDHSGALHISLESL